VISELVFNHQTGIHEQTIRVSNPLPAQECGTAAAIQLLVDGLPSNATVHNADGTASGPDYVTYNQPLAPGESVDLVVEFRLLDRENLPALTYQAQVVDPLQQLLASGTPSMIDRIVKLQDERFMIEFTSIPDRTYAIQYSSDLKTWKTATPFHQATSSRVQWIDNGPPKTESSPAQNSMRFYRLILLSNQ